MLLVVAVSAVFVICGTVGAARAVQMTLTPTEEKSAQVDAYIERLGISEGLAVQDVETEAAVAPFSAAIEEALGKAYAGMWIDPWHARFDIGVAPSTKALQPELESMARKEGVLGITTFAPVKSTVQELLDAKAAWDSRLSGLMARGQASTGLDAQKNAVSLQLSNGLPASEVSPLAQAAAAEAVAVEISRVPRELLSPSPAYLGECSFAEGVRDRCSAPLVGGTEINLPGSLCTGGFMARSIKPAEYPDHYLLSAGHCGSIGQTVKSANVSGAEHSIGTVGYSYRNTNGDAMFIDLSKEQSFWEDSNSWGWYPYVYTPGAKWGPSFAPEDYPINIVGTNLPPNIQYQTPCHSGWRTGVRCGLTEATEVTITEDEIYTIGHLVQNYACGGKGDSGGPWIFNNYAMGLMVAIPSEAQECRFGGHYSWFDDLHWTDHVLGMAVVGFEGTIE
ncbi:MAG: S1 family peptidase [Solirubrobacteraceae bacterium]